MRGPLQYCGRVAILASVIAAAVTIAHAHQIPRDVSGSDERTRTIHGRVVDNDTRYPVRNTCVAVAGASDATPVLTDSNGRFALTGLAGQSQTVSLKKTGYASMTVPFSDGVEARLTKSATIIGRVFDDFGVPLALAQVVAERRSVRDDRVELTRETSAETDDTGAYELFGLPPGDYVVGITTNRSILMPGAAGPTPIRIPNSPVRDYYPGTSRAEQAETLSLRAGSELTGINFTLSRPPFPGRAPGTADSQETRGSIRGRVTRADGSPARRAGVDAMSQDAFSPAVTVTDDDGLFELSNVVPGGYVITAMVGPLATATFGRIGASDRGELVVVRAGAVVDHVDMMIAQSSAINGRVVDEYGDPIENATVMAERVTWSKGRNRLMAVRSVSPRQTNSHGRFRIFGLPPGQYFVSAVVGQPVPGFEPNELPGYLKTYFPGTAVFSEAQLVEVDAGREALNAEFALVRGRAGRITGHVFKADGQAFTGVVSLIASHRSGAIATPAPQRTRTENGSIHFDHLPHGEYVIQAARSREGRSTEGESGLVFVTVNDVDAEEVAVRLSAGSSVTGRLTFEGDAPPSEAEDVELSPVPSDLDYVSLVDDPVARADIHEDWSFEMHGPVGPRRLTLLHAPEGWMLETIYLNGVDVTDTPLSFGAKEQSVSGVEVVLTNHLTEIAGVVADDGGRLFSDAGVIVFATNRTRWYPASRFLRHVDVSRDGTFSVRGIPPGDYYVTAINKRDESEADTDSDNPDFLDSLIAGATQITVADGQRALAALRVHSR